MKKLGAMIVLIFVLIAIFSATSANSKNSTQTIKVNDVSFTMVFIPDGEFIMGSPEGEGRDREHPQHLVKITSGFWMGQTEVTQALWQAVMGSNPSYFSDCDQCPVEKVNWKDCQDFLSKLNSLKGSSFRLPTAAEWEYACRAGTTTAYSFGNDPSVLGDYAWFWNNSSNKTHPVAQKQPNPWGLCDMHGNVWEWCQDYHDYYGPNYYSQGPVDDPRNDTESRYRVLRGGSYVNNQFILRSAFRFGDFPDCYHDNIGLRLAHPMGLPEAPDSDGDGVTDDLDKCPGTPHGVQVDERGCPIDSDGDGVPDYKDQCPGTPKGVEVDAKGCPLDSDGDGVPDYRDQCPNTPKGVKVDSVGCPLDTDKDGVYDYKDKCPGTPMGVKVDKRGCWVIGDVKFDFDKWDIKRMFYPVLDEVLTALKKNPNLKVEIQGHADSTGTVQYNQSLSEKRAKAVMEYLVKKGIEKERLFTVGYGLKRPIASNATKEGRARNRRVEFRRIP